MEKGYSYDGVSDVEGIFTEEFRKYVLDHNLFCRRGFNWLSHWVVLCGSAADPDISRELQVLFNHLTLVLDRQCLVQFWRAEEVPSVDDFGKKRQFRLTTRNQISMFTTINSRKTPLFGKGIFSYRMKMDDIVITLDGGGGGGPIGRAFRNNRIECTPNIGYYSYEEHPHRDLALSCDIKYSYAIPLSHSSGRSIGVLEIASTDMQEEIPFFLRGCCRDIWKQDGLDYDSNDRSEDNPVYKANSEIREVMQLVGQSCSLVCAGTWMLCNRCSYLSTSKRVNINLSANYDDECSECIDLFFDFQHLMALKMGEGVVGKAAASSHNLVYCDDVSQFSITKYPLAHIARHLKLTACFATCLRSNHTGNQIYVLEFFLDPSKVNGRDPSAVWVPILEGMRKNFQTFKFASGEEIRSDVPVQVIDARSPDKFEILENHRVEMDLYHSGENVVNTVEGGVAIASLDKQHNGFETSSYSRGGELAVHGADVVLLQQPLHIDGVAIDLRIDCVAIDHGENMGSGVNEQRVALASLENQHNNATISSDERGGDLAIGVINSDISRQPLVEANVVHPVENVVCASKLPPRRGGNAIDISLEELEEVYDMKRKDAAKRLKVSLSTFKRACRSYDISRWPPRKKNLDLSRFGNSAQIGSTKILRGSAPNALNESVVTIKAKYRDGFIKFQHSASWGIDVFNQQMSKRLKLEAGSYEVKYQDDENDWIFVKCDDDLRDCISSSASLGKTTLKMLLEPI